MDKYYFKIKFINLKFQANLVGFFPSYSILTEQHITSPIIQSIKIIIMCQLRIKSEPFSVNLKFKSEHLKRDCLDLLK